MSVLSDNALALIANELNVHQTHVLQVIELLESGNTIPFIARFRKDRTGGLDDDAIRAIKERVAQQTTLSDRKATILKSIEAQGRLTERLRAEIENATNAKSLEDAYLPYKPKKQSLASLARQRGLEPLARHIIDDSLDPHALEAWYVDRIDDESNGLPYADAMSSAGHIIAEEFGVCADVRQALRQLLWQTGKIVCSQLDASSPPQSAVADSAESAAPVEPSDASRSPDKRIPSPKHTSNRLDSASKPGRKSRRQTPYEDYFGFREPISRVPPHRVLAINRGEREKSIRVRIEAEHQLLIDKAIETRLPAPHRYRELLLGCLRDALSRMLLPALEREIRRELTENAERHAVQVFAKNLKQLLLQRPTRASSVLAIAPGFKNGCQVAVLDSTGQCLECDSISIIGNESRRSAGRDRLIELAERYHVDVIAIGNGAACRQVEELVGDILKSEWRQSALKYVVVNEAGASVYSTSSLGREELPELDATHRSAVSIGRRLLDPLSELVKISAANIGVGMYQHDVKAKHLKESLDDVVASCVNFVGVDVNTASPALLSYVSGLNQLTARRIVEFRTQHGSIANREQLKDITGIGSTTFVQAAGFLRINDGDEPLDATWIHPESYDQAKAILSKITDSDCFSVRESLGSDSREELCKRLAHLDVDSTADELRIGRLLLQDIIHDLNRPGRDPREDLPPPVFRRGVVQLEDLEPGMELDGRVVNVVDFGVFVDIGLGDSGLIHISKLSEQFIADPHDFAAVGDLMHVWVLEIDRQRRRVSLSAIPPRELETSQTMRARSRAESGRRPSRSSSKVSDKRHRRPLQLATRERHSKKHERSATTTTDIAPISEAMVTGKAPMRSFSDLKQFFDTKSDSDRAET